MQITWFELQFTFSTLISHLIVNNATIMFHKIPNDTFNLNLKSRHIFEFEKPKFQFDNFAVFFLRLPIAIWFTLYGWLVPSFLSIYYHISTREARESESRVRSKYRWLGTSKGLRSSCPLPISPLGFVFFRVVFTFGLLSFLSRVSMTLGHCNTSLEPPKYKKQQDQINKSKKKKKRPRRLKLISQQLCRPKFIVKSPKRWLMLKD